MEDRRYRYPPGYLPSFFGTVAILAGALLTLGLWTESDSLAPGITTVAVGVILRLEAALTAASSRIAASVQQATRPGHDDHTQ